MRDTPYKFWRRKTGVDGPIASNEAMELGHHMEPAVVTMFAARTGAEVRKDSEGDWIAVDTIKAFQQANPAEYAKYVEPRQVQDDLQLNNQ